MQIHVLGSDVGTGGTRSLVMGGDGRAFASAVYFGVKDFAHSCMRIYLIIKERAARWNRDKEIHAILQGIARGSNSSLQIGQYSRQGAAVLLARVFNKDAMSEKRLPYERLDQLTVELLAGLR
jgi:xylose isomerase